MDNAPNIWINQRYPREELLKKRFQILFGNITGFFRELKNIIW